MLNYIKSELYRTAHNKSVYVMILITAGLTLLLNVLLWLVNATTDSGAFAYGITSYSYSFIVSGPTLYFYMAFLVASVLYEADRKNGVQKNSIACGITRLQMFAGKCAVCLFTCTVGLAVILGVYIGSASLLLIHSGPVEAADVLMEIPAVYLMAAAAGILAVVLAEVFEKTVVSAVIWFAIMFGIPELLFYLGFKFNSLWDVAMWMPTNIFKGIGVSMTQCVTAWDTPDGMLRCLISGAAGIVVFSLVGAALLRRKEY